MGTRVLVAYASKNGSTADIALVVAEELRREGAEVDLVRAAPGLDVRPYDALVVGSAVYMGRWRPEALAFLKGAAKTAAHKSTWLFSTGPLDGSAERGPIAPVAQVAKLMARLPVREHVTFGGALLADAEGFVARAMVRNQGEVDFRNFDRIRAWARCIAAELSYGVGPAARTG